MAYIGTPPADRFVATKAASVYSGDGSTTAFTLEHAVGSDEDILVSVDGVIQEPSVAYAVSSGTTLTFTGAPSSNSGNNIFVYYLFRAVGTVGHPSNQALSATNGTFSGNTTVAGTSTFTGDVTIGDASAADKKILFDGNAQDYHIGLDDSADSLIIGKGSALGTTTSMAFDANGIITKPLQPAFLAKSANNDQTNLTLNTNTAVAFGTEIFDNNSDFASNVFTAPVTGRYHLNFHIRIDNIDSVTQYTIILLVTSNRNLQFIHGNSGYNSDMNYMSIQGSHLVDMDAGDTAGVHVSLPSLGTAQADISSESHFSGYLVA